MCLCMPRSLIARLLACAGWVCSRPAGVAGDVGAAVPLKYVADVERYLQSFCGVYGIFIFLIYLYLVLIVVTASIFGNPC